MYHVRRHFDVTMTKRQNTNIQTENFMTSFLSKTLETSREDFHKILFAHTKFGIVRIMESGV